MKPAVEATKKAFRIYRLFQKDNPPEMTSGMSGKSVNTIHRLDLREEKGPATE